MDTRYFTCLTEVSRESKTYLFYIFYSKCPFNSLPIRVEPKSSWGYPDAITIRLETLSQDILSVTYWDHILISLKSMQYTDNIPRSTSLQSCVCSCRKRPMGPFSLIGTSSKSTCPNSASVYWGVFDRVARGLGWERIHAFGSTLPSLGPACWGQNHPLGLASVVRKKSP